MKRYFDWPVIKQWVANLWGEQIKSFYNLCFFWHQAYLKILDSITVQEWDSDCELAHNYFKFLEHKLVFNRDMELVTYERLNKILPCKRDCYFDLFLSVDSSFSANLTTFALNALSHLDSDVSCKNSIISKYVQKPQNAANFIANISIFLNKL